jgi:tetratricopeptide (TPR) repeat protein
MKRTQILALFAVLGLMAWPAAAAAKKEQPLPVASTNSGPTTFAPLPADHELAAYWNDPEVARRLLSNYGFAAETEPRLYQEDLNFYTNKIAPLLKEDRPKALPLLEARVKQPGVSAQFDFLLGTLQFEAGDFTNAVKNFENALTKAREFRRAQKSLALALARSERHDEAARALVKTIGQGGGDMAVYALLGNAYMNLGRYASAEAAFKQALMFDPDKKEFKLALVKCALAGGNNDYALALLDELLLQYPDQDSLWSLQANVYLRKEQPAKALVSLELLRRLGKADAKSLFLLGDLYMNQEARDLALGTYLEAIEKDGGKSPVKSLLRPAGILVSRSAWDESKKLFAKIREVSPNLAGEDELRLLKLEAKVAMGTGEDQKAIQTLEQIKDRNPLDGEALLLAGDYYARHDQPEKATDRFKAASSIEGFEADAFVKLAQLSVKSQKYTEAVELLRKAQKANPRDNVQRYLDKVEQLSRSSSRT